MTAPAALAHRTRLAVVLGALSAFGPITTDLYLPSLPEAATDLHASQPQIQATLTTCLIGLALGQVFVGPLSDAVGRRRPMIGGVALFVVSSLLCAMAPTVYLLDFFRLVQGLAGSAGVVLSLAIVRDLLSGVGAAQLITALSAVGGVAPILAPVIGAQLLRVMDWRGLFYVLAGLGAVLLAVAVLGVPESLPYERRNPLRLRPLWDGFATLSTDLRFVGFTAAAAFAFATMFSYISTSPFVFQEHFGFTQAQFSALFAVNASGMLTVNVVGGRLMSRVSGETLVRFGLAGILTGAVGMLVCSLTVGLWGIVTFLFLTVIWVVLVLATLSAFALEDHAAIAGTASALVGASRFALGGIMAAIAGTGGADPTTLAVVMTVCATIAVASFFVASFSGARHTRHQA
ncbi:multidrug effflux MFS transporter [Tsukamurella soli]|uniref:Multidrug effflux MFS transporter n=1 Tax=Tsukamurella soli TaxID=644556 RepID=A0ABP8JET6_9ACTN